MATEGTLAYTQSRLIPRIHARPAGGTGLQHTVFKAQGRL